MARRLTHVLPALLACFASIMGGCASPRAEGGRFAVEPGGYGRAFEVTRSTLTDLGWTLDRVDAGAGVITTEPRASSLLHADATSLRIEFIPTDVFGRLPTDTARTQIERADAGSTRALGARPLIGQVTALRVRAYRPIFRPQVVDVIRSGRAVDPLLLADEDEPDLRVPLARDPETEARAAGAIALAIRRDR